MKIACCIFSYNITKGMKSLGPIGTLKRNSKSKSLIITQIEYLRKIFKSVDIYVISGFGFEKLNKVLSQKKTINSIVNNKYETKNYAYALKLLINSEQFIRNAKNYDGLLLLDSNVLLRSLPKKDKHNSWILVKKHRKNYKHKDYLGININQQNNFVQHLFYNIGNHSWCKSFYLTKEDLNIMIKNIGCYHDNMFVFEIINDLIDNCGLKIMANSIENNSNFTEITGIKDKNKIK